MVIFFLHLLTFVIIIKVKLYVFDLHPALKNTTAYLKYTEANNTEKCDT